MEKSGLPLPPGWRQLQSDRGTYFWNKEIDKVQWKFPKDEALAHQKLIDTHGYVNVKRTACTTELQQEDDRAYDIIPSLNTPSPLPSESQTATDSTGYTTGPIPVPKTTDHDSPIDSSPPPPLPSRNYDEDDYNTPSQVDSEVGSPSPPPLPERTDLSEQLISPTMMQQFLYSSNASDIHHIPLELSSAENRPVNVVYDEPSIVNTVNSATPILYDEIITHEISIPAPPTKAEFMIAANPPLSEGIKSKPIKFSGPEKNDNAEAPDLQKNETCMYDEIPSTITRVSPHHKQTSPQKESLPSQEKPSVPAYQVVPLASVLIDDGLMTVSHEKQRDLLRDNRSCLTPTGMTSTSRSTPPLPPRKASSVKIKRKKDSLNERNTATIGTRNPTAVRDDSGYDRLIHDKFRHRSGSATLPRNMDDHVGYSKLSNDALLMRSGVAIKGSQMSASNSSLSQDVDNTDMAVPLIHAPNAPSVDVKPRPHMYEDLRETKRMEDDTSLVWDSSDMTSGNGGIFKANTAHKEGKKQSPKLLKSLKPPLPIEKPQSVSDEDFERRLERLDNHFYPEIDIPAWPSSVQDSFFGPRRASEIKRSVRDSWNSQGNDLPPGWKREVNEQGQVFYWHLPTGNIQYTKPEGSNSSKSQSPADSDSPLSPRLLLKPMTFAAVYMGSIDVPEDRLVKGRSVRVVFNAIEVLQADPSPDLVQLVAHFKRYDRVHLQVHGMDLKWLDVANGSVLITQPINRIRVWGVGQNNNRDFGYVSRNMTTQRHQCHVFTCDIAAAGLIQSLLDNHEANKKFAPCLDGYSVTDIGNNDHQGSVLVSVPFSAAHRQRSVSQIQNEPDKKGTEKYKRLEAVYLGCRFVTAPQGITVINESVAHLSLDKTKWLPVYVDVATSHVRILDKKSEIIMKEHRIRFLSFLGIARDDKYCGYVVDNGDNQFQFHGFFCNPNCDKLCLALHSACQSRYQKVIDSRITDDDATTDSKTRPQKKSSLLKRIGSWKTARPSDQDEENVQPTSRNFVVQFLGIEVVNKSKGVDVVTEPLQKAAKKTSGIHLVELVISGTGFTINDPQKKQFASKHISSKKITYCVRIRSHFVFIAKEGSKYMLYMFSESEVDASSLVTAVQELMS